MRQETGRFTHTHTHTHNPTHTRLGFCGLEYYKRCFLRCSWGPRCRPVSHHRVASGTWSEVWAPAGQCTPIREGCSAACWTAHGLKWLCVIRIRVCPSRNTTFFCWLLQGILCIGPFVARLFHWMLMNQNQSSINIFISVSVSCNFL